MSTDSPQKEETSSTLFRATDALAKDVKKDPRDQNPKIRFPHHCHYHQKANVEDYVSQLEFSSSESNKNILTSLIYIRPDLLNITPLKIPEDLEHPKSKLYRKISIKEAAQKRTQDDLKFQLKTVEELSVSSKNGKVYLWKIWPGNNQFYLKGRLITGPKTDKMANTIAWIFILLISIAYFSFVFRHMLTDVTFVLPMASVYSIVSTISFFILVSFTDPGIIPRKGIWEIDGEIPDPYNGDLFKRNSSEESQRSLSRQNPLKFCQICQIYKPARAIHCRHCGNCVEEFERHCHFMRNCIGKRNYKYFIGFIISLILLVLCYILGFSIMIIELTGSDPDVEPCTLFESTTATIVITLILGVPACCLVLANLFYCFFSFKKYFKQEKENKENKNEKLLQINYFSDHSSHFNKRRILNSQQLERYFKIQYSNNSEETESKREKSRKLDEV